MERGGEGADVDRMCEQLFLSHRARERDDNLLFVRERLLRSDVDLASLVRFYARLHTPRRKVPDDETNPLVSVLRLSGVVRERDGCLEVRNRIYTRVFDRKWVTAHLPDSELRRLRALAEEEARKRRLAEERELTARRYLYVANMILAQQAAEVANFGRAVELLEEQIPEPGQADLRGFEWRYLWRLCRDDALFTLSGHAGWVLAVAFSPDGQSLVTASADRTAKLWDLTTREIVATLTGHKSGLTCLAFSPYGTALATGSRDKTVKLWNVPAGREVLSLRGHQGVVYSVAFSPDGSTLATASADKIVRLWRTAAFAEIPCSSD